STLAHVRDNAAAADLRLSAEDIRRIEVAFPRGPRPRSLPML
ncbi:MAG TPA: aldo/keto reductase, partial [bacterium]|nr:aldo/keto reductase [bacterium]